MPDLVITPADVKPGAVDNTTEVVTAGEAITEGMALYQDPTTSKWLAGDCTNVDKLDIKRIALSAGGDEEPIVVARPDQLLAIGATTAEAQAYILSTAGGICPIADLASGDHLVIIGYGASTTLLDFRPYKTGYQMP